MYLWIKNGKKEKKVVQLFAQITESFLRNALPAFTIFGFLYYKKEPLNNVSFYQKDAKDLIRVAANMI